MNKQDTLMLDGPAGKLEVLATYPDVDSKKTVGIICHPNPLHEGTMNNKVVTTVARAFEHLGLATVRFNFRGVGKSEGSYGNETGEMDDLLCVIQWVQDKFPGHQIWLAGFSFGSFIAAAVANKTDFASQLFSIAPAVNWHDFSQLNRITCPWHAVIAEADEIVPFDEVMAYVKNPPSPLDYHVMPGASHFFHGLLIELRDLIERLAGDTEGDSS